MLHLKRIHTFELKVTYVSLFKYECGATLRGGGDG
jgi:hypothetical protein